MTERVEVRRGEYYDSVRLMGVGRRLREFEGVEDAIVAMGTALNLDLVEELGFARPAAGADDLVVAVRGSDAGLAGALAALEEALVPAQAAGGLLEAPPPHIVGTAARRGGLDMALISVPGEHAFVEAMEALRAGLHVMVFSDNVPVPQEVRLKEEAAKRGLLIMGPDCGTAIVNGVGLGFANVVRPGPVSIVGASGTGIQQLCCLLDESGAGIRHALGTGGRDLSLAVGGATLIRSLAALDDDPGTDIIVVVSKPPDPAVAARVRKATVGCSKPVVTAFVGEEGVTLEGAAADAVTRFGVPWRPPRTWPAEDRKHRRGALRGFFSGGTLCDEAIAIGIALLGSIGSEEEDAGHVLIDFGADRYTRGRPHPMIDQYVRLERLAAAADDPSVGVILLDVVLGHAAHPDPASELAPVVESAVHEGAAVVVSMCGTEGDPQNRARQIEVLHGAGASVFLSNAAAARHAAVLSRGGKKR